jgi:ubiquinone/menaquinone biosynthesis C-methylase UbiE
MNVKEDFEKVSYQSHERWFAKQFPNFEKKQAVIQRWLNGKSEKTINYWIHERLFELARPIIQEGDRWLTVGDGYGFDANFLKDNQLKVTATDIGDAFLGLSKENELIDDYSIENVERLTFKDNFFDYAFCKESYHHFPRAYMGVYEMLRVTRKAIIIIEPQDPLTKMPLMLAIKNILDRFAPTLLQKYWKNRYSFEEVGNYVFKLSDREMEKLAMGMNLPAIAFKGINNPVLNLTNGSEKIKDNGIEFRKLKRKLWVIDLMTKLGIIPHQVLSAIIFKTMPSNEIKSRLKNEGYLFIEFPKNPYL